VIEEDTVSENRKNGRPTPLPPRAPNVQDTIVERVVLSPKDAPVRQMALVLSDAVLAQLVIKGPLPAAR
jgi:hypothetical protein